MTLEKIEIGESAIITAILNNEFTLKLIEMGFYENKMVQLIARTFDKETVSVKIGHSKIMLRKNEAQTVIVRKCSGLEKLKQL